MFSGLEAEGMRIPECRLLLTILYLHEKASQTSLRDKRNVYDGPNIEAPSYGGTMLADASIPPSF